MPDGTKVYRPTPYRVVPQAAVQTDRAHHDGERGEHGKRHPRKRLAVGQEALIADSRLALTVDPWAHVRWMSRKVSSLASNGWTRADNSASVSTAVTDFVTPARA